MKFLQNRYGTYRFFNKPCSWKKCSLKYLSCFKKSPFLQLFDRMTPFFLQKGSKWSWGHHVLEFSKAQVIFWALSLTMHMWSQKEPHKLVCLTFKMPSSKTQFNSITIRSITVFKLPIQLTVLLLALPFH